MGASVFIQSRNWSGAGRDAKPAAYFPIIHAIGVGSNGAFSSATAELKLARGWSGSRGGRGGRRTDFGYAISEAHDVHLSDLQVGRSQVRSRHRLVPILQSFALYSVVKC